MGMMSPQPRHSCPPFGSVYELRVSECMAVVNANRPSAEGGVSATRSTYGDDAYRGVRGARRQRCGHKTRMGVGGGGVLQVPKAFSAR